MGDNIALNIGESVYELTVLEVKPADAVCIIDTDLAVDFAPPLIHDPDPVEAGGGVVGATGARLDASASVRDSLVETQRLEDDANMRRAAREAKAKARREAKLAKEQICAAAALEVSDVVAATAAVATALGTATAPQSQPRALGGSGGTTLSATGATVAADVVVPEAAAEAAEQQEHAPDAEEMRRRRLARFG